MASWNGAVASRAEVRERKRRVALKVAARIFNEKGYHNTSLDEIADEIGVTKTALYYYFKNKEELLYECLKITYDCGQAAQREAEALDGGPLEKLTFLYHRFVVLLAREHGAFTITANIRALPAERQQELLVRRGELDRYSRALLSQAIEEGAIREVDVRVTSKYFLSAANWILRWSTETDDPSDESPDEPSVEEVSALYLDLLFNGISKHSG